MYKQKYLQIKQDYLDLLRGGVPINYKRDTNIFDITTGHKKNSGEWSASVAASNLGASIYNKVRSLPDKYDIIAFYPYSQKEDVDNVFSKLRRDLLSLAPKPFIYIPAVQKLYKVVETDETYELKETKAEIKPVLSQVKYSTDFGTYYKGNNFDAIYDDLIEIQKKYNLMEYKLVTIGFVTNGKLLSEHKTVYYKGSNGIFDTKTYLLGTSQEAFTFKPFLK